MGRNSHTKRYILKYSEKTKLGTSNSKNIVLLFFLHPTGKRFSKEVANGHRRKPCI